MNALQTCNVGTACLLREQWRTYVVSHEVVPSFRQEPMVSELMMSLLPCKGCQTCERDSSGCYREHTEDLTRSSGPDRASLGYFRCGPCSFFSTCSTYLHSAGLWHCDP
eukprot:3399715-Amphidinium_carterae.2